LLRRDSDLYKWSWSYMERGY